MKVKFPIGDCQANRKCDGIALIITLILLAVVLVMAIAFLAISQREQGSVVTSTDTATARLAADSALANAEAQIIANVYSTTNPNPYNFGLLVSTNYINANAFTNGSSNPLNVNYYDSSGNLLSGGNLEQNVANLFYLPRPPVFIITNQAIGSNDFRYYLDLDRNGKFEATAFVTNFDNSGNVIFNNGNPLIPEVGDPQWVGILERPDTTHGPNNHFLSRYAFIAMPIGNTLDLNYIHNQTMTRAVNPNSTTSVSDGYFRNQGVGSWEINLAAFLTDLNTNEWDTLAASYNYQEWMTPSFNNTGFAFQDALSLLSYRYSYAYNSLAPVGGNLPLGLFTTAAIFLPFQNNIDLYSDWNPPMAIPSSINVSGQNISFSWAGADNTNHFFSLESDLFDPNKVSPSFINRLSGASTNNSTYDRYTFYRLLSQLGTDSEPEENKINLNYSNAIVNYDPNGIATNITIVPNAETNFMPWRPIDFFTVAANQMLKLYTTTWFKENPSNYLATYYGIQTNYFYNLDGNILVNDPTGLGLTNIPYVGLTNAVPDFGLVSSPGITNLIPVYVNGQFVYSPAVNRLLQLAANIYDATTNKTFALGYDFPSVFRPVFYKTSNDIYIDGFDEITRIDQGNLPLSTPYNLNNASDFGSLIQGINRINIFGVPMIIGAKKGFPNFNQFALQSIFQITRKVELIRGGTNETTYPPSSYKLAQQFTFGSATNSGLLSQLEVECLNSYATNYARITDIYVTNWITMNVTNDEGLNEIATFTLSGFASVNPVWTSNSFVYPLPLTNATLVPTNWVYSFGSSQIVPPIQYETNVNINGDHYPQPRWWLITTNNIQIAMVDDATGRLIDYVQLSGPNSVRDIYSDMLVITNSYPLASLLIDTNYTVKPSSILPTQFFPAGLEQQLEDSQNNKLWDQPDVDGFNSFIWYGTQTTSTNLTFQVFSPPVTVSRITTWEANDPLVHYIPSDLTAVGVNNNNAVSATVQNPILDTAHKRYQPWGKSVQMSKLGSGVDGRTINTAFKDPLVWSSDYWDFPVNKFPTVGWLGRVHRGTPWQTVYLKASNVLIETNTLGANVGLNTWEDWTGNGNLYDAVNDAPLQDIVLFDLFTTAPNENATHGQLSVNAAVNANDPTASLAAWSALFGGVMVLSNNASDAYPMPSWHSLFPFINVPSTNFPVGPAGLNGINSALGTLVTNINYTRATFTNADGLVGTFEHLGDILHSAALTERSPFLNWNSSIQASNGISDEMYEWLPQQAMSLLRVGGAPRYVIYCYGQTLKPAPGGVVTSGGFFGMVTNYQITAETATRTVVRVDGVTDPVDGTPLKSPQAHPHVVIESFNILPPD